MEPVGIGLIGCGNIAAIYAENAARFAPLRLVSCADLLPERAKAFGREHGIAKVHTVEGLLGDPAVEVVLNLTIPAAHIPVSMAAIAAGKHVYSEKPLALDAAEGQELLDAAAASKRLVGCAPDTFLGAAHQTARKAIDDGWIGETVSATAFMQCHGHESWHPSPAFYYEAGGGPLFDMGPYYLTALVNLLGPVAEVSAMASSAFPERVITSEPRRGERIQVKTPTHIAGTAAFASGVIVSLVMSFDVWQASLPHLEIHGTQGSMQVPDPNAFGGCVRIWRPGYDDWKELPNAFGYAENSRGLGLACMAHAVRGGAAHRATGALAQHVLETMEALLAAAGEGGTISIKSAPQRPKPLPMGLRDGEIA
jgi:predicted dehydrogenase